MKYLFKTYDDTTGLALLVRLRCFGEYSYHIVNPILFYTNVAAMKLIFMTAAAWTAS